MRSPLLSRLREMASIHQAADATGRTVAEVQDEREARRLSRRDFLGGAAVLTAGTLLPGTLWAGKPGGGGGGGGTTPRIAIIGGGIAGLTAALTLKDAGFTSTVYEASEGRIGGRMLSEGGGVVGCGACHAVGGKPGFAFDDDLVVDLFGSLIDTGHTTMIRLAQRFGLPLIDLIADQPAGSTDTNHFNGAYYTKAAADADFALLYPKLKADLQAAGYPTLWNSSTAAGRALDAMSIADWITSRVPGGLASPMGKLLDAAYAIEYGADIADQSALNMLYLLAYNRPATWSIYGESDERYHLAGGIERLPKAIAAHLGLGTRVLPGYEMMALAKNADGTYAVTFDRKGTITADVVILALPFSVLRTLDVSKAGFDALKMRAINELGAGHNGKVNLQFNARLWRSQGPWGLGNGNGYSDRGYQTIWESTRGQSTPTGMLCYYTGGSVTDAMALRHSYGNTASNTGLNDDVSRFFGQIEPVFPGLTALYNGKASGTVAHENPLWNCSYAYWKVGQCQAFAGYEAVRQGNVLFAGEHTSQDFQGFMEGGASEGVRAANELITQLRGGGGKPA